MRLLLLLMLTAVTNSAAEFDHSPWDRVLKRFVNDKGEVDYGGIKKDRAELDRYLAELAASSPRNKPELFPTRDDAMAYWINAYNAFVTSGVAEKYPTASVRDLGFVFGFFRQKQYVAGGATLSADDIEHGILRKEFKDPRVHCAIVCASLGCPFLSRDAYLGRELQKQLDRAARHFVSEERNVSIDAANNQIVLSKILDWYGGDFGGEAGVREFVKRYASDDRRRAIEALKSPRIRYRDYDWRINDPGSRK